jgi:methyl-accepting chemotaxis protein
MADGDFTQKVEVASSDEIGLLGQAFKKVSRDLSGIIRKLQTVANHVISATQKIRGNSKRVLEGTRVQAASTEKTLASVADVNRSAREIAESTEVLSSSAAETSSSILEMSSSMNEVAKTASGLASSVEDTAVSITQMSASIRQVAENAGVLSTASEETATAVHQINTALREVESHSKEAATLSEQVSSDAQNLGMRSIEKTIESMNRIQTTVAAMAEVIHRLGERSEQIGKILTVIHEVNRQTNLLALNAAILAAQAGEQGKGFAVVADEIKSLADRTSVSTKEIAQLIANVQGEAKDAVKSIQEGGRNVDEGVALSLEAGDALRKILERAQRSTEMARSIERSTVEQAKGIKQVTDAMTRCSASRSWSSKSRTRPGSRREGAIRSVRPPRRCGT